MGSIKWIVMSVIVLGLSSCFHERVTMCPKSGCEEMPESLKVKTSQFPSFNLNGGEGPAFKHAIKRAGASGHVDVTAKGKDLKFQPDDNHLHWAAGGVQMVTGSGQHAKVVLSPEARQIVAERTGKP